MIDRLQPELILFYNRKGLRKERLMGGRGSASGLSANDLRSRIPDSEDFKVNAVPKTLEGTEKQVEWAKKIRNEILRELASYTIRRTSDGRPSDLYDIAKKGTDAILKDIRNNPLIEGAKGKVREEKINNAIKGYRDLSKRISRLNEISSNTSASFWIDNRTNQQQNFLNKKLKKKIDGK